VSGFAYVMKILKFSNASQSFSRAIYFISKVIDSCSYIEELLPYDSTVVSGFAYVMKILKFSNASQSFSRAIYFISKVIDSCSYIEEL
jgi:HJR/Mrr/RecB family endonuclease